MDRIQESMGNPKQEIVNFLSRFFRHESLGDDDDIFAAGFVNSLIVVQLISFLESRFSLTIEDEDLEIANFRSVNRILSLVARKAGLKLKSVTDNPIASAVNAS